jgi:hypothetical protein
MPRASVQQSEAKEKGERSSRLRPGRVHRTNASPPRVTGTARICFDLSGLLAGPLPGVVKPHHLSAAFRLCKDHLPFQRRAIVNVRYASARTPGGWKAHGTYIERESAKGDRVPTEKEKGVLQSAARFPPQTGLAWRRSTNSVRWLKAGRRLEISASSRSSCPPKTRMWISSEPQQTWWPGSSSTLERRSNGEAWSTATPTIHTPTSLCEAGCHPGSRSNFHRP